VSSIWISRKTTPTNLSSNTSTSTSSTKSTRPSRTTLAPLITSLSYTPARSPPAPLENLRQARLYNPQSLLNAKSRGGCSFGARYKQRASRCLTREWKVTGCATWASISSSSEVSLYLSRQVEKRVLQHNNKDQFYLRQGMFRGGGARWPSLSHNEELRQ
jgi:hypothetical protein